jgi:hypothetical protein
LRKQLHVGFTIRRQSVSPLEVFDDFGGKLPGQGCHPGVYLGAQKAARHRCDQRNAGVLQRFEQRVERAADRHG